jgi:hypothetical protein
MATISSTDAIGTLIGAITYTVAFGTLYHDNQFHQRVLECSLWAISYTVAFGMQFVAIDKARRDRNANRHPEHRSRTARRARTLCQTQRSVAARRHGTLPSRQ